MNGCDIRQAPRIHHAPPLFLLCRGQELLSLSVPGSCAISKHAYRGIRLVVKFHSLVHVSFHIFSSTKKTDSFHHVYYRARAEGLLHASYSPRPTALLIRSKPRILLAVPRSHLETHASEYTCNRQILFYSYTSSATMELLAP